MKKAKAVAIFSGGMDSTTLIYDLLQEHEVSALSFNYGQRHAKELSYASDTAKKLGIEHEVIRLTQLRKLLASSALTNPMIEVPDGHYTDASMKITVVPNRNAIMLSVAYGHAVAIGADVVATAVHAGDHAIYPDCREEFLRLLETALQVGNDSNIELYAPYVLKTKAEIAYLGSALNVPWNQTWSCYKGHPDHCGTCGTCVERREAFQLARVPDPTIYESEATIGA